MNQRKADTSGWTRKLNKIESGLLDEIAKVVETGTDQIVQKVDHDVSGPQKYIQGSKPKQISPEYEAAKGGIPVPRITGQFARSVQVFRHTKQLIAVFLNSKIAKHARKVHDGDAGTKPRPVLRNAINERKPAIQGNMNRRLLLYIRKHGQAK